MSSLFADRILHLAVTGNLVRIEMGATKVPRSPSEPHVQEPAFTVVMPLDGFVQSVDAMNAVINQLVADGVLTRNPHMVGAEPSGPAH